jgi:hypothetical protein
LGRFLKSSSPARCSASKGKGADISASAIATSIRVVRGGIGLGKRFDRCRPAFMADVPP